jgi:flagellin-specific chaperone FliS
MVNHLSQANIHKSKKPISDVKRMMTELREAWREVAGRKRRGKRPPSTPPAAFA